MGHKMGVSLGWEILGENQDWSFTERTGTFGCWCWLLGSPRMEGAGINIQLEDRLPCYPDQGVMWQYKGYDGDQESGA